MKRQGQTRVLTCKPETSEAAPVGLPVDHHRDPLPGPEGSHALQLFVGDPDGNQELLRVAGAQPAGETAGQSFAVSNAALMTLILTPSVSGRLSSLVILSPVPHHLLRDRQAVWILVGMKVK